ncbi:MAG: Oligoendopeptidase [Cyanobacteria bacterium RYN_339]|nr:Oligoendopeptidase [Cyanobacteria bacterium RYN_339]
MKRPVSTPSRPEALTPESVGAAYADVTAALPGPDGSPEAWEAAYWRWNDLKLWISGEISRRYYREAQDTRDEVAAAAFRYLREHIMPLQEEEDAALRRAFLASPCRPALEAVMGAQQFARLELEASAFAPVNIALATREGEIVSQVERAYGTAEVMVGGKPTTLSRANALLNDPDEAVRREAWDGLATFQATNGDRFQAWYDELTDLRGQMGRNLGEPTFTRLGYRKMGRTDYGPEQVAVFRASIRQHVRPLLERVRAAQAGWLGAPTVKPWNMTCFPGLSLGTDVAPVDQQLQRASQLFHRLHPKLAAHFDHMVANDLIDLEARPGKRPGPFAIAFEDEAKILIFCNSSGAETDVTTLTHEMGHAFQAWESLWIRPLETRLATMDAAELTSMGMEYLALKEITAFFTPEQARRFSRLKLINALQRMSYVAVVDEFQHWVYENPGHSHQERGDAWVRAWDTYVPAIDFAGEEAAKRLRWTRQSHIFSSPFYYIDYALAEVGALQLWSLSRHDHDRAMQSYLELCRIGGTHSLVSIFQSAGLRSPFEPDVLAPIVAELAEALEL